MSNETLNWALRGKNWNQGAPQLSIGLVEVANVYFGTNCFLVHSVLIHYLTHTNEKPHFCTLCEKIFADSCALKRHIQFHTGNSLFHPIFVKRRLASVVIWSHINWRIAEGNHLNVFYVKKYLREVTNSKFTWINVKAKRHFNAIYVRNFWD